SSAADRELHSFPTRRSSDLTALLLPFFTLLEPARETINYGQINLILMGLVAADCLLPRIFWPRGLLVGLAAGMKLTPLGFLLFLDRKSTRLNSSHVKISYAV